MNDKVTAKMNDITMDAFLDTFMEGVPPFSYFFSHMSSFIDWCEPNYGAVSGIVEFFNSISNIPFFFVPVLMYMFLREYCDYKGVRIVIICILIMFVGVSSLVFHATLSFGGQVLDQLSILWLIVAALLVWLPRRYIPAVCRTSPRATVFVVCGLTLVVSSFAWVNPVVYGTVISCLTVPITFVLIVEMRRSECQRVYWLGVRVLITFSTGSLFWLGDRFFCDTCLQLGFPYLHSLWHIFIASTVYQICVIFSYFDAVSILPGNPPTIKYWPLDSGVGKLFSLPYFRMARIKSFLSEDFLMVA